MQNDIKNEAENQGLTEKVKHAVKGDDEAMDEVAPKRSFAFIAVSYPLLLIATILLLLLFWKLMKP